MKRMTYGLADENWNKMFGVKRSRKKKELKRNRVRRIERENKGEEKGKSKE